MQHTTNENYFVHLYSLNIAEYKNQGGLILDRIFTLR